MRMTKVKTKKVEARKNLKREKKNDIGVQNISKSIRVMILEGGKERNSKENFLFYKRDLKI